MTLFFLHAYDIVRRPRRAFAALVDNPTWAPMLAATTLVTFLGNWLFLVTATGQLAITDRWERLSLALGRTVEEAAYARFVDLAASHWFVLGYSAATALAVGPVTVGVLAAALSVTLNRTTGHKVAFGQVLAVATHAGVILAVRQIVATPLDYVRESVASPATLAQFAPALDETSSIARFLGSIDLFVVWWLVVLAIGLSALYPRSARKLAFALTGVYVALGGVVALAVAATRARS